MKAHKRLTMEEKAEIKSKCKWNLSIYELMENLSFNQYLSVIKKFIISNKLPYCKDVPILNQDCCMGKVTPNTPFNKYGLRTVNELKLQIGRTYYIKHNGYKPQNEDYYTKPFYFNVLKEYRNFYLGTLSGGIKTTVFKHGSLYEIIHKKN